MASRIFCEPDSAPIQTSAQPARRKAATVGRVIKSTRDCILKGTAASRRSTAAANSPAQLCLSAKMSSANHRWSAPHCSFSSFMSWATLSAEREWKEFPEMGLAHQLQRYGHPRLETRLSEKNPCALFEALR